MASRSLHCLVSLNYDILKPVYNDKEIVHRRSYSMDDVVHRKTRCDFDIDTSTSRYMEKLKENAIQRNKIPEKNDQASSTSSESPFLNEQINKQDFTLIWLDQTLDTDKPDLRNLSLLRDVVHFLRTFTDPNLCRTYLESIPKENVYLIVSGTTGRIIVPIVHDWTQVRAIYVLCRRAQQQTDWTSAYAKIRESDIFTSVNPLVEQLKVDLYKCQKVLNVSYKLERSIIDIHYQKLDFQWSYLLMQTLVSWPEMSAARNQMIKYMRDYYNNSSPDLNFLDELTKNYTAAKAVYWYTRPACLYRLLNCAFRQENIDEIFKYRSFVKDLSEQIKSLYIEQREYGLNSCILYRGTCLAYDDIAILKANQGKLISFNGFLSTSMDRDAAKVFIEPGSDQQQREAVLFGYYIDAELETSAYAYISHISANPDEQEILFDIGAIFCIDYVKYDIIEKIWLVRCILCEKNEIKRLYFDNLTKTDNHFFSLFYYGRILTEMGDFKRAKAFFTALVDEITDNTAKALCYFGLAIIYGRIRNPSRSASMYAKALEHSSELGNKVGDLNKFFNIFRKVGIVLNEAGELDTALECFAFDLSLIDDDGTEENNKCLAITLGAIGRVYVRRGEIETALKCYQQEISLSEALYTNTPEEVDWHQRMGEISMEQGQYDVALEHFGKALTIVRTIFPSNHGIIQTLNNDIGLMHLYQGHLDTALEYFTTVSNFLSGEPLLNSLYFELHGNFGHLYFLQGNYDLAVTSFEKAIANHLDRHPSSCHINLALAYVNLGRVLTKQCKFDTAESTLLKACDIYERNNLPLKIVECYRLMTDLYRAMCKTKKAFMYTAKILAICKQIYGENHTSVGITYRDIGALWHDLGDKKRALQFIIRSILILEALLPCNPGECAASYESMGTLLLNSSNTLLAIEFYTKALNSRKKHSADDHPDIGRIYFLLGRCCLKLDQFDLALQNYQKALLTGAERHLVELDLAELYLIQNQYDLALTCCEQALAYVKSKYDENHEQTIVVYSRTGMIHSERNEYDIAAQLFIKVLNYFERNTPDNLTNILKYLVLVGEMLGSAGRYEEALDYFERALKKFPKGNLRALKTRWMIVQCYQGLTEEHYNRSEWSKSLEFVEQMLAIYTQWFPSAIEQIGNLERIADELREKMLSTTMN